MRTVLCAKQGSPVSVVNSLLSLHLPISSPHLLLYLLIVKLSLPALFLAFLSPSLTPLSITSISYFSCFYNLYTAFPLPLSALHAFITPPYTQYPSPTTLPLCPHNTGYNSRGKFIRSKNKHVCLCAPAVACPPRLRRVMDGPVCSPRLGVHSHTPQNNTHTHFLKDTQKQLLLLFCGFVITVILHQANVASVPSCGFTAVRMKRTHLAAIKCLLLLPRALL